MAKIHSPAARRLVQAEATIKRQADHIHELETAVVKLKARLATYGAKLDDTTTTGRGLTSGNRRRSSHESSVAVDSATAAAAEVPSYLQPTVSFRAKRRLADVPESPTEDYCCHTRLAVNGQQYMYVDGVLVSDGSADWCRDEWLPPSYARSTNASECRNKERKFVGVSNYNTWGSGMDESYPSDTEDTDLKASYRELKGWDTAPSGWKGEEADSSSSTSSLSFLTTTTTAGTTTTESETEPELEPGQYLEERLKPVPLLGSQTRLSEIRQSRVFCDDDPPVHPATWAYLPSKYVFRQLRRAHTLAQEAFHSALRQDWPEVQRSYFPGGPHEVRFGRTDMEQCTNVLDHRMRKTPERLRGRSISIISTIQDMAGLRNAVCHYTSNDLKQVTSLDRMLQLAQYLAVELLDEARARKIRAIRDAVWERAVAELRDIEEKEALVVLPGCRLSWKVHQQELFKDIRSEMYRSPPDSLLRAADQWKKEQSMNY